MTPAMYLPTRTPVEVIQDGEQMAYVKFPTGKVLWVNSEDLDFDDIGDDDWGDENDDNLGFNDREADVGYDDYYPDAADQYDFEYDK